MDRPLFVLFDFVGMSADLASLHGQVYDLSRIRVNKVEVNDVSLDILTEQRLPSPNEGNGVSTGTMVEPNLTSYCEKTGASPETVSKLHLTSPNERDHHIEHGMGPGKTSITEISGQGLEGDFFTVGDNERADPSVDPLLSENKAEEVDYANIASPALEPFDSTGHATGYMGDALDGMVHMSSLNEPCDTGAALVSQPKKDALSVELDCADLDKGEAIAKNEVEEKDGYAMGEGESVLGDARQDPAVEKDCDAMGECETILVDVREDPAAFELVPNAIHRELEYLAECEIYGTMYKEQQEVELSSPGLGNMQDGVNTSENPDVSDAYGSNMVDAGFSGFDLHDRDVSSCLAYNFCNFLSF